MPRKIGLFPNIRLKEAVDFSLELAQELQKLNLEPLFSAHMGDSAPGPFFPPQCPDLILSLGGDGTLLKCLHSLEASCPILGVNLGSMGFLTASDRSSIISDMQKILQGSYIIQERSLVQARCAGNLYWALNECSIAQKNVGRIFTLDLEINGIEMGELRGDGVLISTATGSTAYALACGGPLISPALETLLLCAISPHSLFARPLVFSSEDLIKVKVPAEQEGLLVMDGQNFLPLTAGDEVEVNLALKKAQLVVFDKDFFLRAIIKKLSWGHR